MVATAGDTPIRTDATWKRLAHPSVFAVVAILVVFVMLFRPSIAWMIGEWTSSSGVMSHSYLIVAIAGFLTIRALPVLANVSAQPAWWLLPIVAGMSLGWLLAYVANVALAQTLVLPALLLATVTAALGFRAGKAMAFAIGYLYFAIPALEHLQFIFQDITIVAVHAMVRLVDISAIVDGMFVHLPEGTFAIEGGCSGLNYVIAGTSLAVLYSHLYCDNWKQAARLILLFLAVSMIGNWIRVFAIVIIGYQWGMDHPLVADHLWLGWVIFFLLLVPTFLLIDKPAAKSGPASDEDVGYAATTPERNRPPWVALGAALLAVAVGPAWAYWAVEDAPDDGRVDIEMPEGIAGWGGPFATVWDWQPKFVGVTAERLAEYRSGDDIVLAYANVYLQQSQGRELIYFDNSVLGNWDNVQGGQPVDEIVNPRDGDFNVVTGRGLYGTWVIAYRYIIGGTPETGQISAKIRQSVATLLGRPEAGLVAYAARCSSSCDHAASVLGRFLADIGDRATIYSNIEATQ